MLLVDVHAHLDMKEFDSDLDEVIQRAKKEGVKAIITNGINHKSNLKVLEISEKYSIVKAAIGLYPEYVNEMSDKEIDDEIKFIEKNKNRIIAIGEVGLDFKNIEDEKQKQKQINAFKKIITLAKKIKKPIIVHTRKAEQQTIEILEKEKAEKVVLHCFSGKLNSINKAAELKYYFSVTTNIVRSEQFQKMVEIVDLNQILTETDAPFLSPFKDKRNEPAFIIQTINKIAEIKSMDKQEVANNIFMNYQRVFMKG
ncbi:MAG: TatD family hydrolase [Candidatus Nanoarchaeia archaeon]|nr:TatD family hydrolase [Candidatus Nanoarchaeia archaeon]